MKFKTIKELEKEIEIINKARKELESGLYSELQKKGRKLKELRSKYGDESLLKAELKQTKEICKMIEEIQGDIELAYLDDYDFEEVKKDLQYKVLEELLNKIKGGNKK